MAYPLRGVGSTSRRPRYRILRFEEFFDIKKGSASGGFGNAMIARRGGYPRYLYKHSSSPCRRHKTSVVKSYMISIYYRNSETSYYLSGHPNKIVGWHKAVGML